MKPAAIKYYYRDQQPRATKRRPSASLDPKRPYEKHEQQAFAAWCDWQIGPDKWLHVPNERIVTLKGEAAVRYMAALRAQGFKDGAPDNIIFVRPPYFPDKLGVVVELKRVGGDGPTADQRKWLAFFEAIGFIACVAHGSRAATDFLQSLGYGRREQRSQQRTVLPSAGLTR